MTKQKFLEMSEKECIEWLATINDEFQLGRTAMNFNLYKKDGRGCRFPADGQRFFIEDHEFVFIVTHGTRGKTGMHGFGKPMISLLNGSYHNAMKCGSDEPWTKRHLLFLIRQMKKEILNNLDSCHVKLATA